MKINIALINSENKSRYNKIKPSLDLLQKELTPYYDVKVFEITKQPKKVVKNIWITLFSRFLYSKYSREYQDYKNIKKRIIVLDIISLLKRFLITFINNNYENWRCGIVIFVADKHIRAWNLLLEQDADLLICFENDAIFTEDSISNIKLLLRKIKIYLNRPLYIDLAGGCDPKTLAVENLELKHDSEGKYYKKPVTNTVCCYLANRKLVEIAVSNLMGRPWLRLLSADWILNKIFMLTARDYKYYCYHTYPSIFRHGSVMGEFASLS